MQETPALLWTTFPALEALPEFRHAFTLRHPDIPVDAERAEVLARLADWHGSVAAELGFVPGQMKSAEQVHGRGVTVVTKDTDGPVKACDGLICGEAGVLIGIYVADCCAIYLVDPVKKAFGVLHSGRKGSELNIISEAITQMGEHFGTQPQDLIVQLSPCIRPPAFEIDFAGIIRQHAREAGVLPENIHDEGVCTSSDLARYYSYRVEKGRTGRMLALLGRLDD